MTHLLNLFRISNQDQLNLRYRLVEIGHLPRGSTLHSNLQRIARTVAIDYGTPAAIVNRGDSKYLAVSPDPKKKPLPENFEVAALQGIVAQLRLLPEIHTLRLRDVARGDEGLAAAHIGFAMRGHLRFHPDLWQGASPYQFYSHNPAELSSLRRQQYPVALYPGFTHRLVWVGDAGLCLAVDVTHLYSDTRTLAERMAAGDDWHKLAGRHFLYEFGPQWYFVQLQEVTKLPINQARFEYPPGSDQITDVWTYTTGKFQGRQGASLARLQPTDLAFYYQYPGRSGQFFGATTLARLRYQNNEPEARAVHRYTILGPDVRMRQIQQVVAAYFDRRVSVDGVSVRVLSQPLEIRRRVFPIPSQLFGHEHKLEGLGSDANPAAIQEMLRTRLKWLRNKQIGPFTTTGITSQFVLAPMSVAEDEELLDKLQADLIQAANEISPFSYQPTLVVWDDRGVQTIPQLRGALAMAKKSMEQSAPACALVILPPARSRKQGGAIRRHLKRLLHPRIHTKCIQADEVLKMLKRSNGKYEIVDDKYRSYMCYTAIDVLVTSGYWLWALGDPLFYDLHVGLDVLNNGAGFTFLASNGKICRFQPSVSEQKEKLSAAQITSELLRNLREVIARVREQSGRLPRHLVLYRDGRLYDTERQGLHEVVSVLKREGLLPNEVVVGVVEIHKTNAERLRLMARLGKQFANPRMGSYHVFADDWGLLCTTGFPALRQGTAEPTVFRIVDGQLDIERVMRDAYWLSLLAWTKPDGVQSDPIVIKLADDWLEAAAAKVSQDDAVGEEDNQDDSFAD